MRSRDVKSINMRFESDVNTFWTLKLWDGTERRFTSIDGEYPSEDYTDRNEMDPILYSYLIMIRNAAEAIVNRCLRVDLADVTEGAILVNDIGPEGGSFPETTISNDSFDEE